MSQTDTESFHITDDRQKILAFNYISDLSEDGRYIVTITKTNKGRTIKQNSALHVWLRLMAAAMSEAGITSRKLFPALREGFEIPPSMEGLKRIVNKVSVDRFGRTTSKLSTTEIQELYEVCNAAFGQSVGVSLPFPEEK